MSMFDDATAVFPNNVAELIAQRIGDLYAPDILIVKRPLKIIDKTQSVGVFPSDWFPDETSWEFPAKQPTIQRYIIKVQSFCKDMSEERGIAVHSVMSKVMRSLLYGDQPLAIGLNTLSVAMDGTTERIQRRGINRQSFLSNEIPQGEFLYLSTIEYYIETETK
jgi:hypothetical protein